MSKKKRVLGDGVLIENMSLIKQVEDQMATRGETIMEVPLDKVREKENVRKEYKGIEELAASIKEKGLLQPIVITPVEGGFYDIIFGHRRYRALVQLNGEAPETYFKIKAIVREKGSFDAEEIREVQLIENIQREALSPLELKGALEYLKAKGLTHREIADRLGKAEGYVKNLFKVVLTIQENPELEPLLAQRDTGVPLSMADLLYLRILPKAQFLKLAEEKIKGIIKTRAELEERIQEVREAGYKDYQQKRDERQKHPRPLIKERKGGALRVRFDYDPNKISPDEKKRIIDTIRELLTRMESVSP